MTTIYVATSGSYSDYGINAVFLDRAAAARYAELRNTDASRWDEVEIEEWESSDDMIQSVPKDHIPFLVHILDGGGVRVQRASPPTTYDSDPRYYPHRKGLTHRGPYDEPGYWSVTVWARDENHAAKIAQDRKAQWRAESEGVA